LRAFEKRVLRRIYGRKREAVAGGWIELHNEELYNSHNSPNISRVIESMMMKWEEHVAQMGKMKNICTILVGET
jgi:hypothetical protein